MCKSSWSDAGCTNPSAVYNGCSATPCDESDPHETWCKVTDAGCTQEESAHGGGWAFCKDLPILNVPICPGGTTQATCCDVDNSCTDGDDDWCCNGTFYCSNDSAEYAQAEGGILCPAPTETWSTELSGLCTEVVFDTTKCVNLSATMASTAGWNKASCPSPKYNDANCGSEASKATQTESEMLADFVTHCTDGASDITVDIMCDDTVDQTEAATYGQWNRWDSCSATCGRATATRTRTCSSSAQYACEALGDATETKYCELPNCCVPSQWPNTRKTCGACSAIVFMANYKTCYEFCRQQNLNCVASFDEQNDQCISTGVGVFNCQTDYTTGTTASDDAYCECSGALQTFIGLALVVFGLFNL